MSEVYTVKTERGAEMAAEYSEPIESTQELININAATLDDLQKLDGIGPAIAQRIIDYRESIGGFEYTYQLLDVSGIGEKMYERIKDKITIREEP